MVLRRIEHEEMGTAPVMRTLVTLAIPAAANGILATLYSFVDAVYIGWLGKLDLNAVMMVMPLTFIVFSLGIAPAIGVSALVSRYLGAGDHNRARSILNHALGIAAVIGAVISISGFILAEDIIRLVFEPDADILARATEYFSIVVLGALFMHVGTVADAALRAQGNTITPMKIMAIANIANMLLDPLFIFGPDNVGQTWPVLGWVCDPIAGIGLGMGVRGAAYATLLTRSLMTFALLASLWSSGTKLQPSVPWLMRPKACFRTIGSIYFVGLPSTIGHVAMSASFAWVMRLLNSIDENAMGITGIGMRLEMFAFVPIFGLFSAVMPMVGYNLGAGKLDRCKETIRSSCWIAAISMGLVGLALMIWPDVFIGLFSIEKDPAMLASGAAYLRINCWAYAAIGCSIMISAGIQGFGRTWLAMLCQILRTLILRLPLAIIFAWTFGWGVTGVWWSLPISNVASFAVSVCMITWLLRQLEKDPTAYGVPPAPDELEAISSEIAESKDMGLDAP